AVPVAAPQQVTDRLPGPLPGLVLAHHPGHMYRTRVPGHTPKTTPGPAIPIPESWLQDQAACSPYRLVNHRIPCQNARNFGLGLLRAVDLRLLPFGLRGGPIRLGRPAVLSGGTPVALGVG